jgi:hypothetical protein
LNRRGFLGALGAAATLGATGARASADPLASRFSYHGYDVAWSGWRESVNQDVTVGFWTARHADHDRMVYATTMGVVGTAREMDVLDISRQRGWPRVMTQRNIKTAVDAIMSDVTEIVGDSEEAYANVERVMIQHPEWSAPRAAWYYQKTRVHDGWPLVTSRSSERERDVIRTRAWDALKKDLDARG